MLDIFDIFYLYQNKKGKKMATRPKFEREIIVYGSDVVRAVRYDPKTCVLDVKTKTGQAYRYQSVWASDFAALVTTRSAGKVFNTRIKVPSYGSVPRKATKLRTW